MARKRKYSLLLIDDSAQDLGPLELSLNLRDIAGKEPHILVAGDDIGRFQSVWRHCSAAFAGTHQELLAQLPRLTKRSLPPRTQAQPEPAPARSARPEL